MHGRLARAPGPSYRLVCGPSNARRFCSLAPPIMWPRCVGVAGTGDAAGVPCRTNMLVSLDSYALGKRVRLCRPLLASAFDLPVQRLMGARRATRTRRAHAASSKQRSRTGTFLPCATRHRTLRIRMVTHIKLCLGDSSTDRPLAGRFVRTVQPASCMFVAPCIRDACAQPAAAGSLQESRRRWHVCTIPR